MAASPKDKFEAAVKVIRGLPKNGSFQPSHELMLKFYSYFKQATEGPCRSSKPAFWDLVNKRKWEAWSHLGDMQSEQAMLMYVDELKKIVETMPQTEAVTEFLQKLDNFYEMVEDSENHNTLKMIEIPRLNGTSCTNGNSESDDEGQQPSSYQVTQLLKCDLKWWKENPGILSCSSNHEDVYSSRYEHHRNGDSYRHIQSGDVETDEYNTKSLEREEADERPNSGSVITEEWEQVDETRLSVSHSSSSGDSESESDEFCDTSDDPIELVMPTSPHTFASSLAPLEEHSVISTPITGGQSVHFDPVTCNDISENPIVNVVQEGSNPSDITGCAQIEETVVPARLSEEGQSSDLDILMCRGGDETERERRRRGGGQGTRDDVTAANRSGHSDNAGEAEGSNSSGGGQREMFPGPGGGGGGRGAGTGGNSGPTDLNEQIIVTLLRLQHDMSGLLNRLRSLELLVKERKKEKDKAVKTAQGWWPFPDLSMKSALALFVWPLLVHCIITYISRRRRKLNR